MAVLTIAAAARACGVDRSTIHRSIKTGRLSATVTATGERGIDTSELLRVFGPLQQAPHPEGEATQHPATPAATPDATLIEVLQQQLQQAIARETHWMEREQQAQAEKSRLLDMLQAEQHARRDLEQKLLPAPQVQPTPKRPSFFLWVILLASLALLVATWVWPDALETIMRRYISD